MDNIKLVIWDLDETFWKGTLSEEGITPINENIQLVKELTQRGIINGIVSKNDYENAKAKLLELGIWEHFVFPAIEWKPKGVLIRQIIENCQLRDVNVLFIDDNLHNLNEAKYHNPNLHTKTPDFIPEILLHPAFKGKDDGKLSRLGQYKVLEKKAKAKSDFNSNRDFLKDSKIQIKIIINLMPHKERILELLGRANQLNYTKNRLEEPDLDKLLENNCLKNAAVWAKDKYGKYGIIGFYSYDPQTHQLLHFVFSCRIINLGIPQYLFAKLDFPNLKVVPEVAENLDASLPDWIQESNFDIDLRNNTDVKGKAKIIFAGGCDYDVMYFYLERNNFEVSHYVNYVNSHNIPVKPSHSETVLAGLNYSDEQKQKLINHELDLFADGKYFDSGIFNTTYDCLIYNPRMDYDLFLYENIQDNFLIPYGGYGNNLTDENDHENIINFFKGRKTDLINKSFLKKFSEEFKCIGRISPEKFIKNLHEIRQNIPAHIPMILFNCPEIELSSHPFGKEMYQRYKEMNSALEDFVNQSENTFLLDIRKTIREEFQLTNGLGHFQRKYYRDIALEVLHYLRKLLGPKVASYLNLKSTIYAAVEDGIDLAKRIKKLLVG